MLLIAWSVKSEFAGRVIAALILRFESDFKRATAGRRSILDDILARHAKLPSDSIGRDATSALFTNI
jgi:hypothetical protein